MIDNTLEKRQPEVQKKTKIEQLLLHRPIKMYIPESWSDASECRLYCNKDYEYQDLFNFYKTYNLKDLMKEGWLVKSIDKAFSSRENGAFGYETLILERVVEI